MSIKANSHSRSRGNLQLNRIQIHNYKCIDDLDIEFVPPRFDHEPNVTVIGCPNGRGKTSVLECCSLLLLLPTLGMPSISNRMMFRRPVHFHTDFTVDGWFSNATQRQVNYVSKKRELYINRVKDKKGGSEPLYVPGRIMDSLLGKNVNPILTSDFMFFHSYRKVVEGGMELREIVSRDDRNTKIVREIAPISAFKQVILNAVMNTGSHELFNGSNKRSDENHSRYIIDQLDNLLIRYANVKIKSVDPVYENTLDVLVEDTSTKDVFPFDNLSSGQKEIIATLFLIWRHTDSNPSVVLIDEPELHLNRDWQQTFIRDLFRIAPKNQYIIATHSVEIAGSVKPYQRMILEK